MSALLPGELTHPIVHRVWVNHTSWIEPRMGQHWTELEKLTWLAACVEYDTGLRVRVIPTHPLDSWPGCYDVLVPSSAMMAGRYDDAARLIHGIEAGYRAATRAAAS